MVRYRPPKQSDASWTIPLLVAIAISAVLLFWHELYLKPTQAYNDYDTHQDIAGQLERDEILGLIEEKYFRKIAVDSLRMLSYDSLFSLLDQYSEYITADENRAFEAQMNGEFGGFGIELLPKPEGLGVTYVLEGSPAQKAGIAVGDLITGVGSYQPEDTSIEADSLLKAIDRYNGTPLPFRISRVGEEIQTLNIQKSQTPNALISPAVSVNDSTLYIKINRFGNQIYRLFMEQLEAKITPVDKAHLIIDLRGNPGGYLKEAINLLSQFVLQKERILLRTSTRKGKYTTYKPTGKPFYEFGEIAILIDDESASSSEIIAGVLQDLDRAIVIGTPTFGKGSVQQQYPLRSGAAIKLTISKYYLPSGRNIEKIYTKEGEPTLPDTSIVYKTLKGRRVYGGYGILPDISLYHDEDPFILPKVSQYQLKSVCFDFIRSMQSNSPTQPLSTVLRNPEHPAYDILTQEIVSSLGISDPSQGLLVGIKELARYRVMHMLLSPSDWIQWKLQYDIPIMTAKAYLQSGQKAHQFQPQNKVFNH
jgi:carboxyl-terminal processing protease